MTLSRGIWYPNLLTKPENQLNRTALVFSIPPYQDYFFAWLLLGQS